MNIIDINRATLYNLYEQFPESFKNLNLEGNNLIYNSEAIDISNFNINELLDPITKFSSSLSVLSSKDIFQIIKIHIQTFNNKPKEINEENQGNDILSQTDQTPIIKTRKFYKLLNTKEDLTPQQKKELNAYFDYLENLMEYEDYLLPALKNNLERFRAYIYEIEYEKETEALTQNQKEAIIKNHELIEKKKISNTNTLSEAKKLELTHNPQNGAKGSVSTIQIILFIVGISIFLTILTLSLIK